MVTRLPSAVCRLPSAVCLYPLCLNNKLDAAEWFPSFADLSLNFGVGREP